MLPQTLLLLTLPSPPGFPRVRGSERRSERQSPFFEEPEVAWGYCQGVPFVAPPALRCTHELYLRCSTGPYLPTQLGAATVEEAVLTELLSELAVTQGGNLNSGKRETLVHSPAHFPASRTEGKQQAMWRPNPIFNFTHGSQEVLHFPHSQKLGALLSSVGRRATKETVENGWISDN